MKNTEFISKIVVYISILAMLSVGTISAITYAIGPYYDYEVAVGGHIDNAEMARTPELLITELDLAVDGMRSLNLTDDMYSRWYSWKQTPNHRMSFQYEFIESVKERCAEVISWRDAQDLESGQVADVYSQKMDSIRDMVVDCDDIASDAYLVNLCPYYGVYVWLIIFALVIMFLVGVITFSYAIDEPALLIPGIVFSIMTIVSGAAIILI